MRFYDEGVRKHEYKRPSPGKLTRDYDDEIDESYGGRIPLLMEYDEDYETEEQP
jgi:hypothetical protein